MVRTPALCLLAPLVMAAALPPGEAPEVFGQRETVEHVDLSPDGRKIVYLAPGEGMQTIAMVASLDGGTPKPAFYAEGNPERLRWCSFVSNSRLICRLSALIDFQGMMVPASRLVAVDAEGGNIQLLGQRRSFNDERVRLHDGEILDWRPGAGENKVLMAREYIPEAGKTGSKIARSADGLGVDLVDTVTLRTSSVESAERTASDYISDGRGKVRIMAIRSVRGATGMIGSEIGFKYRTHDSSEWKEFGTYDSVSRQGMYPLTVDAELNAAYVLKKLDGRWALYRVKLDGSMATELVFAHDRVDVDDVVRIGKGQRVIGVTFVEDSRHVVYFDAEYKNLAAALSKAVPGLPLIRFAGASGDGSKLLIHAAADNDPGRYFTFDRNAKALAEIMLARPALEKVTLAEMKAVAYPAADGAQVPAYLTLPPGKSDARGLPAVVMPHGGPSARDEWGFDWLAQFLANQGYAVLQPNYRGSTGYGEQWLAENGFKGWRTSIGDVTAGAKWLTQQGIADPAKLAIVGWSYGGYAALQSDVAEPGLFKAVVAIAPVTDLEMTKNQTYRFTSRWLNSQFIGSGPHLKEGSPLRNVERIQAPVLMFHGDRDFNVTVDQSRAMHKALQAAGKTSTYVEYPGLEHDLADSEARANMLSKLSLFLGDAIGN